MHRIYLRSRGCMELSPILTFSFSNSFAASSSCLRHFGYLWHSLFWLSATTNKNENWTIATAVSQNLTLLGTVPGFLCDWSNCRCWLFCWSRSKCASLFLRTGHYFCCIPSSYSRLPWPQDKESEKIVLRKCWPRGNHEIWEMSPRCMLNCTVSVRTNSFGDGDISLGLNSILWLQTVRFHPI